jgi:pimeloyl-ACP methyl ester carboxylesterase
VPRSVSVARLVFLAAVLPEPGKSVRQQLAEDPSMFDPGWLAAGARWFDAAQARDLAREFLFQDVRGEALAAALDTLEMLDTRQLAMEPCPLGAWPDVPAVSVVAADDRTLSPAWGRRLTRQLLGCEPIEIEGGHCPHASRPDELAGLLEQLATGAVAAPPR